MTDKEIEQHERDLVDHKSSYELSTQMLLDMWNNHAEEFLKPEGIEVYMHIFCIIFIISKISF